MQTTFFVVFHQQFATVCQTKHTGASLAHCISAKGCGRALPLCFVIFLYFYSQLAWDGSRRLTDPPTNQPTVMMDNIVSPASRHITKDTPRARDGQ